MYRYGDQWDEFDDGMTIDFRSSSPDSGEAVSAVRAAGFAYDVILVDPFHEYETSAQDLREACTLIKPNGTIVVHDCNPEEEALVTPHYQDGRWCGLTYKAYLDMVLDWRSFSPARWIPIIVAPLSAAGRSFRACAAPSIARLG